MTLYLLARDAALIAAAGHKTRRGERVPAVSFLASLGSDFARRVARRVLAKSFEGKSPAAKAARSLYAWSTPRSGPRRR